MQHHSALQKCVDQFVVGLINSRSFRLKLQLFSQSQFDFITRNSKYQ